ncbi:hypothetical protein [Gimesia maris]|uniref:Uncharacterized protein n=1 Tax=Gimesia maris TaxID=122 RepID=A0ABX5YGM9_9PLAN|nr:hypothetical protein [Gimesia maris]EDL61725.1 hypothetical protein PM8797T_05470 [Gimesia maris DSM 8797]QDT77319.1 hypothetical protein Mal35_07450 [Gimesia maris]QDU12959.1 hypothetical protein CA11_07400 [Gimesia maris]QEG14886.1 hypothetical protein GmarT_07230 [Gimesia maris]QGQ31731.1 hypothetical protein F1729_25590 [Gimesia maris]|tara:strand:+ start:18891 stop:19157 length:267 start_codon:yes stop_codon:yes gene_type:complete
MQRKQSQAVEGELRQQVREIITTQYEVQNDGPLVERLIELTMNYLGDCREAGEIYIIQAIDFAIEQLASESNEVPVYQDAIEYGGGLK